MYRDTCPAHEYYHKILIHERNPQYYSYPDSMFLYMKIMEEVPEVMGRCYDKTKNKTIEFKINSDKTYIEFYYSR